MEEVIYKHETNGEFTGIYAQIEDGKLTITEQDMVNLRKNIQETARLSLSYSLMWQIPIV